MTQVLMVFQIYILYKICLRLWMTIFFTCLVNWMDGPGQVESKEGFAETVSFGAKKVLQNSLCRQLCTCNCQMFALKGNDPVLKLEVQQLWKTQDTDEL